MNSLTINITANGVFISPYLHHHGECGYSDCHVFNSAQEAGEFVEQRIRETLKAREKSK